MAGQEKVHRPFTGRLVKIDNMVGIKHTIVDVADRKSKVDGDVCVRVQAVTVNNQLIVYQTGAKQVVEYVKNHPLPIRDVEITKDYSGYFFKGSVYDDEEEVEYIKKKFNINY